MRGGMHAKRGVRNFAAATASTVIALTAIGFSALCGGSAVAAETEKPQEIAKVTVLRTIVGGRQVYTAP
jgi:hypothetical protein